MSEIGAKTKREMIRALRESGCRITSQRELILEELVAGPHHPSARSIYDSVKDRQPDMSLATVYNTLGTLVRVGVLRILEFDAVENRYDTNLKQHVNLICGRCGKIDDFEWSPSDLSRAVHKSYGFEIADGRFEYHGICSTCAKWRKNAERPKRTTA